MVVNSVDPVPLVALDASSFQYPTKSAIGLDRKIYFNTASGVTYRVDESGTLEIVSVSNGNPTDPNDPLNGAAGIDFGRGGDLYINSNFGGLRKITFQQIISADGIVPVVAEEIVPPLGQFTLGITIDGRSQAYLSSILEGKLYKADLTSDNPTWQVWLDSPELRGPVNSGLPSPLGLPQPFGNSDIAVDHNSKFIYIGTHTPTGSSSTTGVYRVEILNDGSAGQLEKLVDMGQFAANGINFDMVTKEVLIASPFSDFNDHNATGTGAIEPAGGVWKIDTKKLKKDGFATLEPVIQDGEKLGNAVDVLSGYMFGTNPTNHSKLYVNDGSFDTAPAWPNGDGNGIDGATERISEFNPALPTAKLPKTDHPAIRIVNLN